MAKQMIKSTDFSQKLCVAIKKQSSYWRMQSALRICMYSNR